jgi:sulfite exporter TauE/SafE
MNREKRRRLLDYFPLLAYLGFWLQGAALGALLTRDPRLIALGLVTLPALLALGLAAREIRKRQREP